MNFGIGVLAAVLFAIAAWSLAGAILHFLEWLYPDPFPVAIVPPDLLPQTMRGVPPDWETYGAPSLVGIADSDSEV